MINRDNFGKWIFLILLLSITFVHVTGAQVKTLSREYVPIIISGSETALRNKVIQEWQAFRFNSALGEWEAIPYQVDEIDDRGTYNNEKDGVIDLNDELLFMPDDLGDHAPADKWLDDETARNSQRIALCFSDPVDSNKKAWAYLFKTNNSSYDGPGYFDYIHAPANTAADTVNTRAYTVGHNADGWIDYVAITINPKLDLVDRLKLRLVGETPFGGLGAYVFTEDTLNEGSSDFRGYTVRSFHDQRTVLSIPQLWPAPFNIDYQIQYFPYSFQMGVSEAELENPLYMAIAGLRQLRQSLDLGENALGMQVFSENSSSGYLLDGNPDQIDMALIKEADAHWIMASGSQGTIFMVLKVPEIENSVSQWYYRDDSSGGTVDNTVDTGDGRSFGDMGLWVFTSPPQVLSTDRITMNFTVYLLDIAGQDAQFGGKMFTWTQNPLALNIEEQDYAATNVAGSTELPDRFELISASPNPYVIGEAMLQFMVRSGPQITQLELRIYNILGQEVARMENPRYRQFDWVFSWNGTDLNGRPVLPGIYFYVVTGLETTLKEKLIILH